MFQDLKLLIVEHTGLEKDALHIYVALIVFLVSCRLFRWPVSSWKPWATVLSITLLGEALDIRHVLATGREIVADYHWIDLWNTMLVPTVLVLVARYTSIFEPRVKSEIKPS